MAQLKYFFTFVALVSNIICNENWIKFIKIEAFLLLLSDLWTPLQA